MVSSESQSFKFKQGDLVKLYRLEEPYGFERSPIQENLYKRTLSTVQNGDILRVVSSNFYTPGAKEVNTEGAYYYFSYDKVYNYKLEKVNDLYIAEEHLILTTDHISVSDDLQTINKLLEQL